jgi:hypothetical protein
MSLLLAARQAPTTLQPGLCAGRLDAKPAPSPKSGVAPALGLGAEPRGSARGLVLLAVALRRLVASALPPAGDLLWTVTAARTPSGVAPGSGPDCVRAFWRNRFKVFRAGGSPQPSPHAARPAAGR